MNILFVNTLDIEGGAARAAYRLFKGVQALGESARMLVLKKSSADLTVFTAAGQLGAWLPRLNYRLDGRALRHYPQRQQGSSWSVNAVPYPIGRVMAAQPADLYHLHWIGAGFIPISSLAILNKPVLWTLHDEWAYTGGCHYTDGCERFINACGCCPLLASQVENDLSHQTWKRKSKHWHNMRLTIVAPSQWIAQRAKRSSLFSRCRVEVIPNGIDTQKFRPLDRRMARQILNLPDDKKLILFAGLSEAGDRRKGLHLLQPALHRLPADLKSSTELMILGTIQSPASPDFGMPCHWLGRLHDDISISLVYAAADIFVAPSLQDNLPNTVMEAAGCGTSSVAFQIGGMSDLIDHEQNGYLAQPFDTDDLAHGIEMALRHSETWGRAARLKVEKEFEIQHIARRYQSLYQEVIAG
jgi:glycosyltransferase involved in cell wall biosynthesis